MIGAALAATGCATAPVVTSAGSLPAAGSFAMAEDSADGVGVGSALAARLQARGLRSTAPAAYLVEVTMSERPAGAGIARTEAAQGEWIRAPDLRHKRRRLATLDIRIADHRTGEDIYRVTAHQPVGQRDPATAWPELLDAAVPLLSAAVSRPGADAP
jgi:hypothetical protein